MAATPTLVFWRHGRTAWNAIGRLQGQSDVELDHVGHQQITVAATSLAAAFPTAVVVTSDLRRARQTADVLAAKLGVSPLLDERLRERSFGEWEGLARPEIAARWPELFGAWHSGTDASAKPPGGESRAEVGFRVADAARDHMARLTGEALLSAEQPVLLVVSHGAAITAAITALIGEDPATWHGITGLDNANWSVLQPAQHGSNWRLVGHNLSATPLAMNEIFGA